MANAARIKAAAGGMQGQAAVRVPGERARVKIVQGPDYGHVFVVTGVRATIGRGDSADIMLADLKSSRLHAEISESSGGWIIKDLGSANGIMVNGKALRFSPLKTGDTATIGETVFEFVEAIAGTRAIVAPVRSVEEIRLQQRLADEQREKVKSLGKFRPAAVASAPAASTPSNPRQMILVVLAVGVGFWLFATPDQTAKPKKPVKPENTPTQQQLEQAVANFKNDGSGLNQGAEMFMRAGLREYRERNWLRAKLNFENALQIDPGHQMAKAYREHADTSIKEEVSHHLRVGKEAFESGKLKSARGHFEAVERLLMQTPLDPSYIEADDQLRLVNKRMRGEVGP